LSRSDPSAIDSRCESSTTADGAACTAGTAARAAARPSRDEQQERTVPTRTFGARIASSTSLLPRPAAPSAHPSRAPAGADRTVHPEPSRPITIMPTMCARLLRLRALEDQ
jgi:hypothetical protein